MVALNENLPFSLLPDPIFEIQKEESTQPKVKEVKVEEEILDAEVDQSPLKQTMPNHKEASQNKSSEDINRMLSLTPLLLKEPHRFRFFHRAIGRSTQEFKENKKVRKTIRLEWLCSPNSLVS